MANTVWAFATAGIAADPLFQAVAAEVPRRIGEFNAQNMANTVWAFATAGVTADPLFKAVAAEVPRRIGEFNAQDMANTVSAFATESVAADALFKAVDAKVPRKILEFTQNMANTIWAFACVGWEQHHIFRELGSSIAAQLNNFNETEKSQLYPVALYMQVQWPDRDLPFSASLQSLRSCYARGVASPSQLQRDVSSMLRQMGWNHSFEHETAEGFSLDLAQPESKLAVEVDGPSHYLKDLSSGENVVNGATRFKRRQLRSLGWTVAHVSFLDWDHKSKSERRQLVAAKLGDLGIRVEDKELALITTQS